MLLCLTGSFFGGPGIGHAISVSRPGRKRARAGSLRIEPALVNAAASGDGQPRALHINCWLASTGQRREVNLVFWHQRLKRTMELIRGLGGNRRRGVGCVLTIGTYDGIHLGHRALLARLNEHAKERGTAAVLLTFEPMPREFLAPDDPPARLTSLRERWRILSGTGLDYLWLLRFGEALRNLPGEAFAQLVARELRPRLVVVGHY